MKILFLIVALSLPVRVVQNADIILEVGSVLPSEYLPKEIQEYQMTSPSQFRPFIERDVDGIRYVIAYDDESKVVTYLSTVDKQFKSVDGLMIGSYVEVNSDQIVAYPGWEIRGPKDKGGWQPLIGFNNKMTILKGENDIEIKLKRYRLESKQPVKAKIIAFVKGYR